MIKPKYIIGSLILLAIGTCVVAPNGGCEPPPPPCILWGERDAYTPMTFFNADGSFYIIPMWSKERFCIARAEPVDAGADE